MRAHTYTSTRGIQFAASFCKTSVLVCASRAVIPGQRDAIMQRTGHLPPLLLRPLAVLRLPPRCPRASPRLVSLTLKPLKRSHSRPCYSLRRACRARITFGTRARGLLTLLRRQDNSVPLSLKEDVIPAKGIPFCETYTLANSRMLLLGCQENLSRVPLVADVRVASRQNRNF